MPAPRSEAAKRPAPAALYHPLVIVLVAAAAGIVVDRYWPPRIETWWASAVAGLLIWSILRLGRRLSCRSIRDGGATAVPTATSAAAAPALAVSFICNVALLTAAASAAGAWHHCRWSLFAADDVGLFARRAAEPACVEAIAVERPRALPPSMESWSPLKGSRLLVDLVAIRDRAEWRPVSGRATLIMHDDDPRIEAGDRLRCFAQLSASSLPYNPGSFDRAAWRRSDRILSALRADFPQCVSVIGSGNWLYMKRFLDRVRASGNRVLRRHLDPRQAELAAAVLLGMREDIDSERKRAFLTTGTIHLLAISGLHLGILAGLLFYLLLRAPVPRRWGPTAIAVLIVLYALMVDARPSVVRATVLVLIVCAATYSNRYALSLNSLAAAALVVLALNPTHLFQVGPQLSFLCVAGLMWIAPHRPHFDEEENAGRTLKRLIMENLGWFSKTRHKIWRSIIGLSAASMVIWLLTLPLVMARFHILSPVALVLNVLLWPFMCLSLISGFGLLLFGAVCPPLADLFGCACNLFFWLLEGVIHYAQRVPYFWLPGPGDWWLWGFYGGLGLMAAFPRLRPPRRRWFAGLLAGWIAVGFVAAGIPGANKQFNRLDCTFLGVGHGCAALLELPSGKTLLYDAGQLGSPAGCARTVAEFLWHEGRTHVDAVVLSHADADHFNALPELLEKFTVGAVYVSPVMFEEPNPLLAELREALERRNVKVETLRAGDRLQGGPNCSIEVLHPPRRGVLGSDNANSLVLAVECFGKKLLLTGDLEPPGLNDLLAKEPLRCEVLLAPHHGSRKSNSPELARWCRPRWVIVSGGGRGNFAGIEATYRAVGGRLLRTADWGAIRARFTTKGVQLSGFVDPSSPLPWQRRTTISPGERNRGWRKITSSQPENASSISASCRSVVMTYNGLWCSSIKSSNAKSASGRSPSQRVTGRPE
ncbi:MAG: ComEC/Rec2 family competence protein [Pirellulales bacterium]|nr:ComEC/Rec2 family competence protein [Pirellulales bacterium]